MISKIENIVRRLASTVLLLLDPHPCTCSSLAIASHPASTFSVCFDTVMLLRLLLVAIPFIIWVDPPDSSSQLALMVFTRDLGLP